MNKTFYIFLFLILFCCEAKTQTNLIYNGDFEIYDTCPISPSTPGNLQIEHCLGWTAPTKLGTSDYFNICNNTSVMQLAGVPKNLLGYQMPENGSGYCGFFASIVDSLSGQPYVYREYIQTKLTQTLEENKSYSFSFYVSSSESNTHSLIKLGALFSSTSYSSNTYAPIFAIPQIINNTNFLSDTLNWSKIEGSYIANGSENYITIGYFENNTVDTLNNHYDSFNPYYRILSYYYVDGINLMELPCNESIPNVFTPNQDGINDLFKVNLCDSINFNLVIYDRWGLKIFETNKFKQGWDGYTTSGVPCIDGSYFYLVTTENKKKKGFFQLIR